MNLADARTSRPLLLGNRHMVSAGHPLAALAGFNILEAGGNAIDAGVAAGFALNVVHPDMANLGGVAPIMLYSTERKKVTTIAGIGQWPELATLDAVSKAGNGRIPVSPQRWVVPAAVGSWLTGLERYGTLSAAEALAPAIDLAENGFPAHYFLCYNVSISQAAWADFPDNRAIYMPEGHLPVEGDVIRQSGLADTLKRLVAAERSAGGSREDGIRAARDCFYKGDIAQAVDRFSRQVGGFVRASDMAAFVAREEPPVSTSYRGRRFYACGPWSQGPAVLQMLNLGARFDLAALNEADLAHTLIEIVKLALGDRNRHYGDPRFVDVPIERLLSEEHAQRLAGLIAPSRANDVPHDPVQGSASPDTTFVCVVDADGNAFAATPSDSTMLVTPIVPELGFGISDRGLQASLDPQDANCVAPGKRPRLTPNPGLMLSDDGLMVFGTPGGEVQTQAMLQFLVNHIDRGMNLQAACEHPRWASYGVPTTEDPHFMEPKMVRVEEGLEHAIGADLRSRGHRVEAWPLRASLAGGICAVERHHRSAVLYGAADPRRMSYAVGR
ncbi:gamma-glutamyltransferase family protein [Rhizobium sp. BK376]|uniref:gamma-glutamyltransferase family protein n=1 Tax=Rhizobium sp. BK376 TaxID=2512149 RepID=UPI00104AAC16|nr:gamma-glutamyltransferase family protein [Rhizobium sp. BK376]TCR71799.1 gamma-glutamyltransferase 2 [Rhizobium sp. BK376]